MLSKYEIKLYELAYDNLYNLSSHYSFRYETMLLTLKIHILEHDYKFELNQHSQKFKMVKI
jgi:hypothetical protein